MSTDLLTDGARVLRELDSPCGPWVKHGAALPEGTFTEKEFAAIIAKIHRGVVHGDGIITVPKTVIQ